MKRVFKIKKDVSSRVKVLTFTFSFLLLLQGTTLFAQEAPEAEVTEAASEEESEEKKFKYVFFPAYDYRPGFEHTAILMNKFIFNLDNDAMLISDLTGIKSLSNKSWMVQNNNQLYTRNWRYQVAADAGLMLNEMYGIDTDTNLFSIQGSAQRKLFGNLYAGAGFGFSYMDFTMGLPPVMGGDISMKSIMFSPKLLMEYDTRDNVLYPTSGIHVKGSMNFDSDTFGSVIENMDGMGMIYEMEDYFFTRNFLTVKGYHSFFDTWKSVLATQLNIRAAYGAGLPPSLEQNANQSIRGYDSGSFTGAQLYNFDVEYRQYFTNRIGMVVFGSVGFVGNSMEEAFSADGFVPAVGTGLRLMLAQEQKVAFRADVAFGRDGNWSLYFGLSEFF